MTRSLRISKLARWSPIFWYKKRWLHKLSSYLFIICENMKLKIIWVQNNQLWKNKCKCSLLPPIRLCNLRNYDAFSGRWILVSFFTLPATFLFFIFQMKSKTSKHQRYEHHVFMSRTQFLNLRKLSQKFKSWQNQRNEMW